MPDDATDEPMPPLPGEEGLHHVVIVGGGAAGLELATGLGNRLGRGRRIRVTLVERSRTHLWKPLLHEVAAGSIDRSDHEIAYLAQAYRHGFRWCYGDLAGLDRARRQILVGATIDDEGRQVTPPRRIAYDTLVIAIGSVTNDFGTPGALRFAVPLETPDQAARFHRRLVNACVRANAQPGPIRPGQLHVAIIGAGATGTELAAELHTTLREMVAFGLDRIDPETDIRIVLIEAGPRILPALPERIAAKTLDLLTGMGVQVRTGARVSEVRDDGVVLADGTVIASELVVWAAGVKAPDVLRDMDGLDVNRINQLVVTDRLQTADPDVFAIGDCAACPRTGHAGNVPPRAQAAHQQASHLLRQMPRRLAGQPLEPFTYRDFGSLVSLGEYSTVGSLMGKLIGKNLLIEGYFALLVYRSLYLMHEYALAGAGRTLMMALTRLLARRSSPKVKLH